MRAYYAYSNISILKMKSYYENDIIFETELKQFQPNHKSLKKVSLMYLIKPTKLEGHLSQLGGKRR